VYAGFWRHLWNKTLEKLTVVHIVMKFTARYLTGRFITVYARIRQWTRSWDRWIQSTLLQPVPLRFILILFSHLCGMFLSGFLTKTLYVFLVCLLLVTFPACLIVLCLCDIVCRITLWLWQSVDLMSCIASCEIRCLYGDSCLHPHPVHVHPKRRYPATSLHGVPTRKTMVGSVSFRFSHPEAVAVYKLPSASHFPLVWPLQIEEVCSSSYHVKAVVHEEEPTPCPSPG